METCKRQRILHFKGPVITITVFHAIRDMKRSKSKVRVNKGQDRAQNGY